MEQMFLVFERLCKFCIQEHGSGGIQSVFGEIDIGSCLTLYSKAVGSQSLGGGVAAEEVLYLAISASPSNFFNSATQF